MNTAHAVFRLTAFPLWSSWMNKEADKDPKFGEGAALGFVLVVALLLLIPALASLLRFLLPFIAAFGLVVLIGALLRA